MCVFTPCVSHVCDMHGSFKLWVIFTIATASYIAVYKGITFEQRLTVASYTVDRENFGVKKLS